MSLPSGITSQLSTALTRRPSSAQAAPSESAAADFAAQAEKAMGGGLASAGEPEGIRGFRDLPGYGRIETLTVTETTVGADGKPVHTVKELAVCPECGTANCACLSRVTMQSRLDEENAKGVRGAEKPDPMSMLPQSFQQLTAGMGASSENASPRLFG